MGEAEDVGDEAGDEVALADAAGDVLFVEMVDDASEQADVVGGAGALDEFEFQ